MAHEEMHMTSHGMSFEICAGCFRRFNRGEQMLAMVYETGDSAGWHCAECKKLWMEHGEDHLPRWNQDRGEILTKEGDAASR